MGPRFFRVGAPGAPVLRVKGVPSARPRRAFGDFPNPSGGPAPFTDPYNEGELWGVDGPAQAQGVVPPPPTGGGPAQSITFTAPSVPFGESDRPWQNPTTYGAIPIPPGANGANALLTLNFQRNSLIIQNTSGATAAGDIAPTLYIGFNVQPQIGQSFQLAPGLGFFWGAADCPPRDTIYALFGPFVNGGGTVTIGGVIIQGTYAPPA